MRMRVLTTKLRVEIENETRVFLESLNFEIEMRVSQKSDMVLPSSPQNMILRLVGALLSGLALLSLSCWM